jgi:hypothetical protein
MEFQCSHLNTERRYTPAQHDCAPMLTHSPFLPCLLPHFCTLAMPPSPADAFARQLRLHSGFRQQLPSTLLRPLEGPQPAAAAADDDNDAAQAAGASSKRGGPELSATGKRRRWQQQLADVIGSTAGPAAVAATEVFDLVHFAWGKPAVLGMHSVDGAVLVREAGQHQSGAAAPNAPDATGEGKAGARARKATSPVTNSWAYACPITGEMWLGPAGGRV